MPKNDDWLPTQRKSILAMVQDWISALENPSSTSWNIPAAEKTELQALTAAAQAAFDKAQSSARNVVITAECKAAFDALIEKMRFIKSRYFLSPPLTEAEIISLGLKPKAVSRTPIPPPSTQAEADISRPGVHLLELHLRPATGSPSDAHHRDYGYRIYYGVLSSGKASTDVTAETKQELVKVPASGDELPHSCFTHRKKELFDFAQGDSGKTVYFCVRYENTKGESGPWGPLFSAVIP
jgi:hypothetical protein